jgi:hypothetical protein
MLRALTSAGKSWWLSEILRGRNLGVKVADLPGSMKNWVWHYCVDMRLAATPQAACTSTGAWINGLNSPWICDLLPIRFSGARRG